MLTPSLQTIDAILAKKSFVEFVKQAWHVVEPSAKYVHNWHIDVMCRVIQDMLEDHIAGKSARKDTVINVPPGTMKSLIVSVFAPAWMWLHKPSWRSIFASANPRVALRDSVKCRDVVESEWYQKSFRPTWRLSDDQNAKGYFKNSASGYRLAVSIGSKIVGERADGLFVDDPLDPAEQVSRNELDRVLFWWNQAFANRLTSLETGTRCIIMQRLHEDDLAGYLIRQGGWNHVMLPMEYDPGRPDPLDKRTKEGELLFPQRFSAAILQKERERLGMFGWAGQMQQSPVPAGGGMFPRIWWKFWSPDSRQIAHKRPLGCSDMPAKRLPEHFDEVIQSWDCTFKDLETSDWVVGTVWGRKGADKFLLARVRRQMGFSDTQKAIREVSKSFPKAFKKVIEDKANGSAIIETLRSEIAGIIPIEPKGGKDARAGAIQPQVEAGNVYLPEDAPWIDEFIHEFAMFPKGSHDDQVDSTTQALLELETSDAARIRKLARK